MNDTKQQNLIDLKFSVTGKQVTIEKVNINQPLKVSVQKAINETGSTRPIEEYEVLLGSVKLDITQKVSSFHINDADVIMISLKSGKGGY